MDETSRYRTTETSLASQRQKSAELELRKRNRVLEQEIEILRRLRVGRRVATLVGGLNLSDETIKTHVSRTLIKLQCRDRTQAVIAAYDHGLVTPRNH